MNLRRHSCKNPERNSWMNLVEIPEAIPRVIIEETFEEISEKNPEVVVEEF